MSEPQLVGDRNSAWQRTFGAAGFSLIELLIVVVIIGVLSSIAFPLYTGYLHSSRQKAAMQQMRSIADANEMHYTRRDAYVATLDALEPDFMTRVPRDPWGNPYQYELVGSSYRIVCLGRDGMSGPNPPPEWMDEPYEADIVLEAGVFFQAPGVR